MCDYYGRELLPDDIVESAPWSLGAFPAGRASRVTVVAATTSGMIVVLGDGEVFALWPEAVTLVCRDGAEVVESPDGWWQAVGVSVENNFVVDLAGVSPQLLGSVGESRAVLSP